jgi:hypothetical protein
MPARVHVIVDHGLRWVSETAIVGPGPDVVEVSGDPTESEGVARHRDPGGNVLGIRGLGFRGSSISVVEPHLTAFDRVVESLQDRIKDKCLPDEGPDITYERLCEYAQRLADVLTGYGGVEAPVCSRDEFSHVSPRELLDRYADIIGRSIGHSPAQEEVASSFIVFVPQTRSVAVAIGVLPSQQHPLEPNGQRTGLVIHGSPLALLVTAANGYGIADLPLHPLGLLPTGPGDPILGFGDRCYLLRDSELLEYVRKHEIAARRTVRHLVEKNAAGIARQLPRSLTRPWSIDLVVENKSTESQIDISVYGLRQSEVDGEDIVRVTEGRLPDPMEWSQTSFMFGYKSVRDHAYRLVENGVRDLVSGRRSLGRDDL